MGILEFFLPISSLGLSAFLKFHRHFGREREVCLVDGLILRFFCARACKNHRYLIGVASSNHQPDMVRESFFDLPTSRNLKNMYLLYIYIYMLPPLRSLPFLWVSSVQTAERFLRWNTNSVKTIVFVRIIRFILFTLLVLKRSTLFRKGSQY